MTDPTQVPETDNLAQLAALGTEMKALMNTEAFKSGVLLTRARIYEEWCDARSSRKLARLKAEQQALDRLLLSFDTILDNGIYAQEAIRQRNQ